MVPDAIVLRSTKSFGRRTIHRVIIERYRVPTLQSFVLTHLIALLIAAIDVCLYRLAAATPHLSIADFKAVMLRMMFLVALGQEVEYGIAFVSRKLEAVAMAGGIEAGFVSGGERGPFVFGIGRVEVRFVLGHGGGRDRGIGAGALTPWDRKALAAEGRITIEAGFALVTFVAQV